MRKYNYILLFLSVLLVSACFAKKKNTVQNQSVNGEEVFVAEKNKKGDLFKPFYFTSINQKMWIDTALPKNEPILLILFNPGCSHCMDMAKKVNDSIASFKNTTIIFLCGEEVYHLIPEFLEASELKNTDRVIYAMDNSMMTTQIFEFKGIPQIMMYNRKRRLQHIYYLNANVNDMVRHLFAE